MTTYHALVRTQDRAGYNIESSKRFIANAIKRGSNVDVFNSREREYLQRKQSKNGHRTLVYNSYCFIIAEGDVCITMYPLPTWFGKKRYYSGKYAIKDIRKYSLNYAPPKADDEWHDYRVA